MSRKLMINFYIDPGDKDLLSKWCDKNRCSVSFAIRRAVKLLLTNQFGDQRDGPEDGIKRVVGGGDT